MISRGPRSGGPPIRCILRVDKLSPVRPAQGTPHRHQGSRGPGLKADFAVPPIPRSAPAEHRAREAPSDLRGSDAQLRRLQPGIHSLGRRPEVLRGEGLLLRAQEMRIVSRQPASGPGRGIRFAGHRWPTRLREWWWPRVLCGPLLRMRQPGPGTVPASHGPTGLLLGLLPQGSPGLIRQAARSAVALRFGACHPRGIARGAALARP